MTARVCYDVGFGESFAKKYFQNSKKLATLSFMLGVNKKILYNRTRCAYKVKQILKRRTMINQLLNNNLSDYIIQIAQKPNAKEQL